jgi:transcriptional regulator with XRE-family HTH domain
MLEKIKELSRKRGKSLSDISYELGFSENYFYRMTKSYPSIDKVIKIADYFHVPIDYLVGRAETKAVEIYQYGFEDGVKSCDSGLDKLLEKIVEETDG